MDTEIISANEAFELEKHVKLLKEDIGVRFLELAKTLKEIRDNEYYKLLGFETITLWLKSPDISITPSWAWALIGIYETWILKLGREPRELAGIDYTKLGTVTSIVKKNPEQADQWLDAAKALRRIDLQKEVKEFKMAERIQEAEVVSDDQEPFEGVLMGQALPGIMSLEDNSVDVIITSPPAHILPFEHVDWLAESKRVLKKDGSVFIFCTYKTLFSYAQALQVNGFKLIRDIVVTYDESNKNYGVTQLLPSHEIVLWASQGDPAYNFSEIEKDVWKAEKTEKQHPDDRPLNIIDDLIIMTTDPGQTVLDPYAASGNTLLVAKRCGRKYIGIEEDELWYKTILKKLQ